MLGRRNRRLRRQHCSSLCSQSEGHEHVANMICAPGHALVGISVLGRRNIRPPHFASKVSYSASPQTSVACRLAQNRVETSFDFQRPAFRHYFFFYKLSDFIRFPRLPRLFFSPSIRKVIYSRPQFVLLAAASSATFGRELHYLRPRVDNIPIFSGNPPRSLFSRSSFCSLLVVFSMSPRFLPII